jgi:spermidine/putrescine transport system ATP-binding protein
VIIVGTQIKMNDVKVELIDVVKEFPARRGATAVRAVDEVSLSIYDGEFFALLGPSGCGKTTTLRLIAGFEQPTSGQVWIDGRQMQGIPAFQRPVNTVFQDYALFPHMTVLQNVMFGLKMEGGLSTPDMQKRATEALELVRLGHAAKRKPRELSGGQQQRVALARALVKRPAVLLLDEPLGALDLKLRRAMQFELKAMQQEVGITFIYVTHDQEEALTMANRIAVMDGGHVLQVGRPEEIYESPATRFVADFIGETNFISGTLIHREGDTGQVQIESEERPIEATLDQDLPIRSAVAVAVRPEKIILRAFDQEAPDLTRFNRLQGQIVDTFYIGTDTRYIVSLGADTELIVRVQNTGYDPAADFKTRQFVQVCWDKQNGRVLAE